MSERNLRSRLIRLAHERPGLRPDILPLLSKQAAGKSMEETLQPATDRFSKQVIREIIKLMKKDAKGKTPAWTDITANTAHEITFKRKGVEGYIRVFFFSGRSKDIEIQASVAGKSWTKTAPLNMRRDAVTIASDAYYTIPDRMRP